MTMGLFFGPKRCMCSHRTSSEKPEQNFENFDKADPEV